jgi:glucokinase
VHTVQQGFLHRLRTSCTKLLGICTHPRSSGLAVAWAVQSKRPVCLQELLRFAEEELEMPCEVEHVACGTGLKRIYRFLAHKHGEAAKNYVRSVTRAVMLHRALLHL